MLVVGVLQVELMIHDAMTLKDKRRVVKSIKDRIANDFNVSIAEIGALDLHRRAVLGISMVGNEGAFVRLCLDRVVQRLRSARDAVLIDHRVELL